MITIEDIVNLNDELSNNTIKNRYFVDKLLDCKVIIGLGTFMILIAFVVLYGRFFNLGLWLSLVICMVGICIFGFAIFAFRKGKRTDAILVKRYYAKYRSSDRITYRECQSVFGKVRYEKWLDFCIKNNVSQDYNSLIAIKERLKLRLERPVGKWLLLKNSLIMNMVLQAPITIVSVVCGFYMAETIDQIKELVGLFVFLMIMYWMILWMIRYVINLGVDLYKNRRNRYWPLFEVLNSAISRSPID